MAKTYNYMRIYQDLKRQISQGVYPNGAKLPTEAELQQLYQVSRITAVKAMELLQADNLVQRFPRKGTFVRMNGSEDTDVPAHRSLRLGVMLPQIYSCLSNSLLSGIAAEVNRQGHSLMTGLSYSTAEEESVLIDRLVTAGCDGVIVIPVRSAELNRGIVSCAIKQYPLVLVDRYLEGIPLPYVGSDHERAAADAMAYLFSLGHKNIGLVTTSPQTTALAERERGYTRGYALSHYKVYDSNLISDISSSMSIACSAEDIRQDVERMKRYLQENAGITALLCVNSGCLQICRIALKELGMEVPRDMSIISFDAPRDFIVRSENTYIQQQEEEIGRQAVLALVETIGGSRDIPRRLIPAKLCIGASTGKPRS